MQEKEADRLPETPPPALAAAMKGSIKIPSYQEVFDSPSSSSKAYNPPSSFSEAFSFIKSSEFYSPPPPPRQPPPDTGGPPGSSDLRSSANLPTQPPSSSSSSSSSFPPASSSGQNRNAILVSHRQKGNPLLKHIRNVKWVFADVVCDYLLGQSTCALYISLRYHLLHPDYLYYRIRELQKDFKLRVVLCHIDVEDVVKPLHEVTRTAMLHDCTLLCGWSMEECGRYLETIKVYENKPSDSIREQTDTDYLSRLTHALTSIRHVNKTDVITLGSAFGSLSRIMDASMEELARCPGIGERKVKRLYDAFHEPFRRVSTRPTVPIMENLTKQEDAAEPSGPNQVVDTNETTKTQSDTGSSVQSALRSAFAKHAEKIRKQDRETQTVDPAEGSSSIGP